MPVFEAYCDESTATFPTHNLVDLCRALRASLGPGYDFAPAKITDGEIEVKQWPLKEEQRARLPQFKDPRLSGIPIKQYSILPEAENGCDYLLNREVILLGHTLTITASFVQGLSPLDE